jgi:hypothetical protein
MWGGVTDDGFVPWNLGRIETLKQIDRLWDKPSTELHLGDVCWFNLTDAGKAETRRLGLMNW